MDKDFTITLIGKGGRFSTLINEELDFATHPYEVCLQEMVFTPGSWANVRAGANSFLVYNQLSGDPYKHKTLYLPPRRYNTVSDILYALNKVMANDYGNFCDMFFYHDYDDRTSPIIFPQPADEPDDFFKAQTLFKNHFGKNKPIIMETVGMRDKPDVITFGASRNTLLLLVFCRELALILGITESLSKPVSGIFNRWTRKISTLATDLLKNNLTMMWIYGNFVVTTMIGSIRDQILKQVPIQDDTKAILHSVFHTQDFIPVQRRKMQSFEIWIQEGPGSTSVLPIDEEIILVLYFRRIE